MKVTSDTVVRTFRRIAKEKAADVSARRGRASRELAAAFEGLTCEVFSDSEVVATTSDGRIALPTIVLGQTIAELGLDATYVSQGPGSILVDWRQIGS